MTISNFAGFYCEPSQGLSEGVLNMIAVILFVFIINTLITVRLTKNLYARILLIIAGLIFAVVLGWIIRFTSDGLC